MSPSDAHFAARFRALTGHDPFPWQHSLYERFAQGEIPACCDIPTGLGKTAVIAVWLVALAEQCSGVPRRLVYVVNRRTVVDQTTAEVTRIRDNLERASLREALQRLCSRPTDVDEPPLAISTLRGQFADNQEWSADPCRPAVICGTVDMIGSRLLFSGYRIGFKSKPLHAGFLGQDALLVHDEAHLEPAFQKLITDIEKEQRRERKHGGDLPWRMLRVMQLTATRRNSTDGQKKNRQQSREKPFGLTDEEMSLPDELPDPPTDPIHHVWRRLRAHKSLHLHPCNDEKKLADQIAELAVKHQDAKAAVVIFIRKVEDVDKVVKELTNQKKGGVPPDHVKMLTGTIRGLERDQLVDHWVVKCFLRQACPRRTVYLVCTSAGEVGVNLSADHMVSDLSTFDSMAQRLGRVNRFGDRKDTRVDVVYPESFGKVDKKTGELKADEFDKRRAKTLELIRKLDEVGKGEDGKPIYDAGPMALGELKQKFTPLELKLPVLAVGDMEWQKTKQELAIERILAAFAPEPTILLASDILFDAWALTTIRDKMPGRPPVAPYLHGVADDLAQTTIVWRAELDLIDPESPDAEKVMQAILTKHRIRPHETLTTNSYRVADFLKKLKKRADLRDTFIVLRFPRNLRLTTVGKLIDDPKPLNAEPTLVLPASFGGLDDKGTLSADAVPKKKSLVAGLDSEELDEIGSAKDAGTSPLTLDIADHRGYEPYENVPSRIRVLIVRCEQRWSVHSIPGGKSLPEDWDFDETYETSTKLVNAIREQSRLNVRLVQAIQKNDEGEDIRSLVCLSPAPPAQQKKVDQSLTEHVGLVVKEAEHITDALGLAEPYRSALRFAAKWHDAGKKAPIWQRYIGGANGDGEPLGKSAKWRNPKLLAGYRHEFGSLLQICSDADAQAYFTDPTLKLTAEQQTEALDLALHMIATHHGYGRPHFKHTVVEGFNREQEEAAHVDVMRRYARLQRKYGRWGLAYLESLLRAADAGASRAVGLDPETDDDEPEEGDA